MQIYRIHNKINNKNYIGQTQWDFHNRYNSGNWAKWSHNSHLKDAAKTYGIENFEVFILEDGEFSEDELNDLEDYYMWKFNSIDPNGYNFKEAGKKGRNYYNYKEYELIDANGNIYQVINLRQFCKKNKLNYGAMLNMVSGINVSSQGYALSTTPTEKIFNPNQEWWIENIDTLQIVKINRNEVDGFCKKYGLKKNGIWMMLSKKNKLSQRWKLKETILTDEYFQRERKYKDIKLINKSGEIIEITDSIYKFCKDRGWSRGALYDLINGKSLEMLGWRLIENFDKKLIYKMEKTFDLENIKTGEKITVNNVSEFCRERGIHLGNFGQMCSGNIKQYAFWKLKDTNLSDYTFPKKIIYLKIQSPDGRIIEGKNGKIIEINENISSQTIYEHLHRNAPMKSGWKVLRVKYLMDYYPEINNE